MSDKLKMEFTFFQVPNEIFDLDIEIIVEEREKVKGCKNKNIVKRRMKGIEKLVYIYLCRYANSTKGIFPSYSKIAGDCGIGKRTAMEIIDILLKNNLIIKNLRFNNSNLYELLVPKNCSVPGAQGGAPSTPNSAPSAQDSAPSTPNSAPGAPKKEQLKKNNLERTTKEEQLKKESDSSIKEIYDLFTSCGFGTLNKVLIDMLNDDIEKYSAEWVAEAIKESMKRNKRTLGYVEGILKRWLADGGINVGSSKQNPESSTNKKYEGYKFEPKGEEGEIPDVDF